MAQSFKSHNFKRKLDSRRGNLTFNQLQESSLQLGDHQKVNELKKNRKKPKEQI